MVFPTSHKSSILSPSFEEEFLAYIYSGVLFSRNITPEQARNIGEVRADITSEMEIWDWGTGADMASDLPSTRFSFSREISGRTIRFYPTRNYLVSVVFESNEGKISVFCEIQVPRELPAKSVNVRNVTQTEFAFGEWLMAREADTFLRILDAKRMGVRCLLLDGRGGRRQQVIPLPDLSLGIPTAAQPFVDRLSSGGFKAIDLEVFIQTALSPRARG